MRCLGKQGTAGEPQAMPTTMRKGHRTASREEQLPLLISENAGPTNGDSCFKDPAFAANKRLPIHRWVPWIAGFSSEFVKGALERHLPRQGVVLDPFAGVGTTLVESLQAGHDVIGFEINPYAALACRVKLAAFTTDLKAFARAIRRLSTFYNDKLETGCPPRSVPPSGFRTRGEFYSPDVLIKVLIVQDFIKGVGKGDLQDLFNIAFASTMITYSNYSYEPSLGQRTSAGKGLIRDFPVGELVLAKLGEMLEDATYVQRERRQVPGHQVINDSFFQCRSHLKRNSIDLIITSPPYLNNYHYNRNTRPHLYWLELVNSPDDMRPLEDANFGKYWQTVRERERVDLSFDLRSSDISQRIGSIRALNADKGIYGGNGWANYAASYFNDCYEFARCARYALKRGGTALVVLGNSILQGVMIATDQYMGQIGEAAGLELVDIHTPRTARVGNSIISSGVRAGKASAGQHLYEAVVELRRR